MENVSCKEMNKKTEPKATTPMQICPTTQIACSLHICSDTQITGQPIIDVKDLSFSYHSMKEETLALSKISFRIYPGEFLAIVGPSGCGKTTLLSLIAGLLPVEEGDIVKKEGLKTGYMLQKDLLLEWRTIWENVMLGLEINHLADNTSKQYARKLLKEYGLEDFMQKKPSELSGGMRQRVALIRTLVLKPDLLLLDEPFSALDYQTRLLVSADIGNIIRNTHKTAIMITHDIAEAITLADRVLVLSHRPAGLLHDLPIHFSITRVDPLAIRATEEYHTYFDFIWKALIQDTAL